MHARDEDTRRGESSSGSSPPARALHARVWGRVQGVGFRYFVLSWARRLGLSGCVRNMPDGTVELVAEGPDPALQELLERVRQGPPAARVDRVEVAWEAPQGRYHGFTAH